MSPSDSNGSPYLGKGIPKIIEYGKAKGLTESEIEFLNLFSFLERKWISKPSDFYDIDPEIKAGLVRILELESKKGEKEQSRMEAQPYFMPAIDRNLGSSGITDQFGKDALSNWDRLISQYKDT